jgi:hypothetical protein
LHEEKHFVPALLRLVIMSEGQECHNASALAAEGKSLSGRHALPGKPFCCCFAAWGVAAKLGVQSAGQDGMITSY